jgi:tRNA(fMet)-specific endonuclease VapC
VSLTHLLDTNAISRLLKEPEGRCAGRLARLGEPRVCTSIVVAGELRFGAKLRGSARLTQAIERVLEAIPILSLEPPADEHYANIRFDLERRGEPIGPNDLLIAAHARSLSLTLVTENEREFRRVRDLVVENWQLEDV